MATGSVPSASVQAKARALIEMRPRWATVRDAKTGQRRIVMPSLTNDGHVYYVHPAGDACSCKAGQHGLMCGHRLAAREAANHDALDAWLSGPVQPKPADQPVRPKPLKVYEDLMPACVTDGCQDSPEPKRRHCWRHIPMIEAFGR